MAKWLLKNKKADIKKMAETLNISEVLAQVLVNRDINTKKLCDRFLNPSLDKLTDIRQMKDVLKAYDIIEKSAANNEKFVVYGDYDVDGVTSTVILTKGLRSLGFDVEYYIPHRIKEGYGLNLDAVREIKENIHGDVLIMCDNGIASMAEIQLAKELGLKTIIIDHHEPGFIEAEGIRTETVPDADAVIDPKQAACPYPFKLMCAGGLSYRFICGLYEYFQKEINGELHNEILVFAAIATICDIVDLYDENRIIAKNGIALLNSGTEKLNLGLRTLIKCKSYENRHIGEFAMGFIIGPCINASGRLDSAKTAVALFMTEDEEKAAAYAELLSNLNEERKLMTKSSFDKLAEAVDEENLEKVIVLYDDEIHESVAGIVAGRLKERFYRPAIVLTKGEDGAKGSARSIEAYNIYEGLSKCKDLFKRFGGHPMAAGLSLEKHLIPELRRRLNEDCSLSDEDFEEVIRLDFSLGLEQVTYSLASKLEQLRPYGKGNPEPLFGSRNLSVSEIRIIEEKETIIFTFITDDYRKVKGISFGKLDKFRKMVYENFDDYDANKIMNGILRNINFNIDAVYYVDINEYNNNVSVQMKIKDFRIS